MISSIAGKEVGLFFLNFLASGVEDLGFNVLENFSRVTAIAKDTAVKSFENPVGRSLLPMVPEQARSLLLSSHDVERLLMEYDTVETYIFRYSAELLNNSNSSEFSSTTETDHTYDFENLKGNYVELYNGSSLTKELWESWMDEDGRLSKSESYIKNKIFSGVMHGTFFYDRELNQHYGTKYGDLFLVFMTGNRLTPTESNLIKLRRQNMNMQKQSGKRY